MSERLWVCRRKEPILGYVPKNYEKKNPAGNGLRGMEPLSQASHDLPKKILFRPLSHVTFISRDVKRIPEKNTILSK